jgi:hypothetical protein
VTCTPSVNSTIRLASPATTPRSATYAPLDPNTPCMTTTDCAEVLSVATPPGAQAKSGDPIDVANSGPPQQVKLLLIAGRVEGFFVERRTESGELVNETQHDTMDEAMRQIYSEYDAISEWSECPDGVDPLEYIRAHQSRF